MTLLSRAFGGIAAAFPSELQARAAIAKISELKRWTPGKPTFVGEVNEPAISLGIVPAGGFMAVRDSTRFVGTIVPSADGCLLQGRFISGASTRAFTAVFLGVVCLMAVFGVAGFFGGRLESAMPIGFQALLFVAWLCGLVLLGCGVLWNATPSNKAVAVLTEHLQLALGTGVR